MSDVRDYASTNQWLMMNGCDHQPVQRNLSEAIRVANELFPWRDLCSQLLWWIRSSSGKCTSWTLINCLQVSWLARKPMVGTLANTSSSRVYLKQAFQENSNLLEQVVEPLTIITGGHNHKDQLTYAWKMLLQNAPHDSICGCSIDEVHRGNGSSFC